MLGAVQIKTSSIEYPNTMLNMHEYQTGPEPTNCTSGHGEEMSQCYQANLGSKTSQNSTCCVFTTNGMQCFHYKMVAEFFTINWMQHSQSEMVAVFLLGVNQQLI